MRRGTSLTLLLLPLLSFGNGSGSEPPPACEPIQGLAEHLTAGRVILLGELHGTGQSPAFVLSASCQAAGAGLDVVVGLELSPSAQPRIDAFLDSAGGSEARDAVLKHEIWQRSYQDGRTSQAMLELIDGVRRLRQLGKTIRIVCFDASGAGGGQQRERAMAANLIRSYEARPEAVHVILTGHLHSRTVPGARRNREYEPMGYLLGRKIAPDDLVALDVAHDGGTAWVCGPECGVIETRARGTGTRWSIEIDDATRPAGHRGWYHVGDLTASPPAFGAPVVAETALAETATSSRSASDSTAQAPLSSAGEEPKPSPSATRSFPAPAVAAIQGHWQAYEYGAKSWTIRFEGSSFYGEVGPDDWYRGEISIRPDTQPAEIDFTIRDCRCSYRDQTSKAIYRWDGESIMLSAPRPGGRRPDVFDLSSGQVVELKRLED